MRTLLVPLSVLLAIGALLWWTRTGGEGPLHDVSTDVRDCKANLQSIYDGLRLYKEAHGETPQASGVGFFGAVSTLEGWQGSVDQLTCPGPGAAGVAPGTDWSDPGSLDGSSSGYAGRDAAAHPLAKFPAGGRETQALVACDNARGMNHAGVVNVLFSDRTVKTLELGKLIEQGRLPAGTTTIVVGPDSPLEELRVLAAD